ncbi:mannitol dehydrogenase family protein [Microvirga aerilata]|uniref:Mannitol dehydrogenase family protein n=1 Tax=Microvirga aerilata TaxID=670292 RepID=A0A936ZAN6_9HYPH|nr:mannitol dehydrogenase family protein [Microvirga aerilata]MBL0407151.1 mannitol dehydrogenase family protein [Microvirga aerilata]
MVADRPLLSPATLALAKAGTQRPAYDRSRLRTGIVHLGLGAFVRAHQALYTEELLAAEPSDWGMTGVSLQRPDQRDRLMPQGGLYTALQKDRSGVSARIVGSLRSVMVAPEDPVTVVEAMADPRVRIVSLTVTEKGYCIDPATGRLQHHHPDIHHDLEHPGEPRTAVGLILAALERRRDEGMAPFTVLCCDNLPSNGRLLASLVSDFAALRDCGLATWVETHASFPSTMVDRIVPATTADDVAEAARLTGLADGAPVVHEPFRQWVIEDRFIENARPRWERVGAELVGDVAPYEHMKLRLLNGAHSALAYLGYLAGHETIADTVKDPVLHEFVRGLWREEIIPVVPAPLGADLSNYAGMLLERFSNPAIRHRTWQIAMDGSQKLPQRLLATARERLSRDLQLPRIALAVAAWLRYVGGLDESGREIDVRDPLASHLRAVLDKAGNAPQDRVRAVLEIEAIFGSDLPRDARFVDTLTTAYTQLLTRGARNAAAELSSAGI